MNSNFHLNICGSFLIFVPNTNNLCFENKIRKILYTPANLTFSYKVGFKVRRSGVGGGGGVCERCSLHGLVNVMRSAPSHFPLPNKIFPISQSLTWPAERQFSNSLTPRPTLCPQGEKNTYRASKPRPLGYGITKQYTAGKDFLCSRISLQLLQQPLPLFVFKSMEFNDLVRSSLVATHGRSQLSSRSFCMCFIVLLDLVERARGRTLKTLPTDTRYKEKIRYNDNLNGTIP